MRIVETTVIRKVKREQGWGRWPAYVLSEDVYGLWFYSPAGSIYQGNTGDTIVEMEVGQGNRDAGLAVVQLIPHSAWWIASWWSDPRPWISVEICTPPTLIDGEWNFIDLELDPHAYPEGRVEVHDEEEFEAARRSGLISPAEETSARAAAAQVERALREMREPFGRVGWKRLDDALRLSLPPLTELP